MAAKHATMQYYYLFLGRRPVSKVSRLKERPAWCSRQAGIVKAQDPRAGQLVAVQAQSLGSRGAAGSENPGGLGTEARFALQPLARVPRRLHHRRCAAPTRGLRRNHMIGQGPIIRQKRCCIMDYPDYIIFSIILCIFRQPGPRPQGFGGVFYEIWVGFL